jgi:hypothetical protein
MNGQTQLKNSDNNLEREVVSQPFVGLDFDFPHWSACGINCSDRERERDSEAK